MKNPAMLKLVDRYDDSHFAFVRPHYDKCGCAYLTKRQLREASRRARLMGGSWLVCDTPLPQSIIIVHDDRFSGRFEPLCVISVSSPLWSADGE